MAPQDSIQNDSFRERLSTKVHAGPMLLKLAPLMLVMGALINPAHADPIPPPPGLISWWPGDLLPLRCARLACDITGDNDGLLKGGASFRRGLVSTAFSLDGVDDFVLIPDHSSLNLGERDFTIDLWVNFRTEQGEQVIAEKYIERFGEFSPGWSLTKLEDNTVLFAAPGSELGFTPIIVPNTWYFIAVVRQGEQLRMYWDGELADTWDTVDVVNLDSTASLKFGHRCNPQDTTGCLDDRGFYLNGLIDEVELFDRALADDEIRAIFDAGSDGKIKRRSPA